MSHRTITKWKAQLDRPTALRGLGQNKLRVYRQYKEEYGTEQYLNVIMPWYHRRALALFRCASAPLRIETGRYENLPVDQRICFYCQDAVEDEEHVIAVCPLYAEIRRQLYDKCEQINPAYSGLTDKNKMIFILSDAGIIKDSGRYLHEILNKRRSVLYV